MALRTAVAVFATVAFAPGSSSTIPSSIAFRIESLSQRDVRVHISSQPAGLWADSAIGGEPQSEIVARTPADLHVTDSVHTVHVLVLEGGAVRIRFGAGASLQDRRLRVWGRDITLTRGSDGHFHTVWKVQRLVP